MVLLLALACQSDAELNNVRDFPEDATPAEEAAPAEEEAESSSPYVYEEEEEAFDLLTVEEVAQGAEDVIDVLVLLDPRALHDTYNTFRERDEHLCPMVYPYYDYDYWYDTCETAEGVGFAGYAYGYDYAPYTSGYYDYASQAYLYGDATITLPDGSTFEIAGYNYTQEYTYTASSNLPYYSSHTMYGDFAWTNPTEGGNWLSEDYSVDYSVSAGYSAVSGGHYVSYEGGVSGIEGSVNAAVFEEFYLHDAAWGADCELEPSGTISLRDAQGRWYVIEFQGAYTSGGVTFMPHCDGCGDVWHEGEDLGAACPDFSPLLAWEEVPWTR